MNIADWRAFMLICKEERHSWICKLTDFGHEMNVVLGHLCAHRPIG